MKKMQKHKFALAAVTLTLLAAGNVLAAPAAPAAPAAKAGAAQPAVFAKVGDVVITHDDYNAAFGVAARNKFYHGKPPEHEVAQLQRDVSDELISRILLVKEARQRGLRPDTAEVQQTLAGYEQRYGGNENWKKNRDKMIPAVTARLEEDSLLSQLEKAVRNVARPSQKEVRAYYAANPDKFTEPEQLRVSVILLRVNPSSPTETWLKADEEVKAIIKKLEGGADFAAIARERSADESAKQGGDMGYLHQGMLPEGTQAILNALKVGELSNTVQLLEGMAVFRLTDRKPAKLNTFEKVEARATDLLHRDLSDQAWKKLVADLMKKYPAQVDQSRFLPLAEKASDRAAKK